MPYIFYKDASVIKVYLLQKLCNFLACSFCYCFFKKKSLNACEERKSFIRIEKKNMFEEPIC